MDRAGRADSPFQGDFDRRQLARLDGFVRGRLSDVRLPVGHQHAEPKRSRCNGRDREPSVCISGRPGEPDHDTGLIPRQCHGRNQKRDVADWFRPVGHQPTGQPADGSKAKGHYAYLVKLPPEPLCAAVSRSDAERQWRDLLRKRAEDDFTLRVRLGAQAFGQLFG